MPEINGTLLKGLEPFTKLLDKAEPMTTDEIILAMGEPIIRAARLRISNAMDAYIQAGMVERNGDTYVVSVRFMADLATYLHKRQTSAEAAAEQLRRDLADIRSITSNLTGAKS